VPGEQGSGALAQVPAKAPLVVQLRGYERLQERLHALIKNAVPDYAPIAKDKIDDLLKQALDGRELKGITKEGSIFAVVMDLASLNGAAPPKMAILVPVTKYETFRDGLLKEDERKSLKLDALGYESTTLNGEAVYFVNRKNGYAVMSPDPDVAASFVKKRDGLDTSLSKPIARRLMEADVALYVDMQAVNKEFGDSIKQGREFLEQALENSPDKNTAEAFKRYFAPILQAVNDGTALLVTADLRPDGVLAHFEMEVPADSKTNTLLKQWKKLPVAELHRLPAGHMVYSAVVFTPELMKELGPLMYGVADIDGNENKALRKAFDDLADAKPRLLLDATNVPASGLTVWKYDNPSKAVDAQIRLFKALKEGSTFKAMLKEDAAIKENAQKDHGFEFTHVRLRWDLEKTVATRGGGALGDDQKKAMVEYLKSQMGERTDLWFGTDGKTVLQVTAPDWDSARRLVDQYVKNEGTVGETQAFKDAVKYLPADNSMLTLLDVPQYTEFAVKAAMGTISQFGGALPIPIPPGFEKPAVKGKTSYGALGITLESGRAGLDAWLSAASVHEVYKMYLEKLLKPNF